MKQLRKVNGLLETFLIIGLVLIIPLFFAIKSQAGTQTVDATATAMPEWATPTPVGKIPVSVVVSPTGIPPAAAPFTTGKQPPTCTFPLAEIKTEESTPEEYTFSEPQVVLTADKNNFYYIAQWLPDNQRVLISEELRNGLEYGKAVPESIELFNSETGNTEVYATRPLTDEPPLWLPQSNAVVYPVANFLGMDKNSGRPRFNGQVWISYGDPNAAQKLDGNLPQIPFAMKPDGNGMFYFSDKQISKRNASMQVASSISFDPTQWDYAKSRRNSDPVSFEMDWQPGTSLVFLYSDGAMSGGGYTFILNADTGRVCELNLGGWAGLARWSSDGRYLAFIRSTNYAAPTYSADLTVLDVATGNMQVLNVMPKETGGLQVVDDFVWAPDNRHILAHGSVIRSTTPLDPSNLYELYLVDIVSGQSDNVIPGYQFYTNSPRKMAWSMDGSKLLVSCPADGVDRLCIIPVAAK
jgi:dipeptidyl aminopeptidase/acylaminoacyl peptidase